MHADLRRKSSMELAHKEKFTDFSSIKVPDCLKNPPVYSFISQTKAIFYRKYYCTVRNFTNYVAFILPVILICASVIIVNALNLEDPATSLSILGSFIATAYAFNGTLYCTLPIIEREYYLKYALNVMGCKVIIFFYFFI